MNILEHQAKALLREYGIATPSGGVANTSAAAREIAAGLGGERWMVKAQIRAGGRGRGAFTPMAARPETSGASGIQSAASVDEVGRCAGAMLGRALVTAQTGADGLLVDQVYVEQAIDIERELALSLLVDERSRSLALLLLERGGEDIEALAAQHPAQVYRVAVTLAHGVDATQLDQSLAQLGLDAAAQSALREIVAGAFRLLREKDARLIEINPLALSAQGALLALDAKMSFDRNALFRQPEILRLEPEGAPDSGQRLASLDGFNYIPLDGDVACLTVGAGLSMATLDAVRHYRGRPANFLDLPPDAQVNKVVSALEILLNDTGAKSLLVNVFGGGIMRCDTIADAILLVNHSTPIRVPMSIRLTGTNSELANRRLKESVPQIHLASNLAEAAEAAVRAARGEGVARAPSPSWRAKFARALGMHRGAT